MAGGNPFAPPGGSMPAQVAPGGGADPSGPVPQPGLQGQGMQQGPLGGGGPVVPPSKAGQPFADVHQNLKYVQSQFKQGQQAQQVLDHLRKELDGLMDMGDTVRPENVIEAAGRLVGHGLGASQLASIMADMPAQGGEGLASWIRMHDVVVSNAEQQLVIENRTIQHNMGVAAVTAMAATHMESRLNQTAPTPSGAVPSAEGEGDNQLSLAPRRGRPPTTSFGE